MKTKINNKKFDCLANKWQAEELIYEETKDLTDNEILEYFRKSVRDSKLDAWWKSLKKQTPTVNYSIK